jgi:hypothetical protein
VTIVTIATTKNKNRNQKTQKKWKLVLSKFALGTVRAETTWVPIYVCLFLPCDTAMKRAFVNAHALLLRALILQLKQSLEKHKLK